MMTNPPEKNVATYLEHSLKLPLFWILNNNNNNGIASCQEREQSPTKVRRLTADKLLSYAAHDGEGQTTIHPRMSLPRGDVGMGDIPATKTVK